MTTPGSTSAASIAPRSLGVDTDSPGLDYGKLKSAGFEFAMRYLTREAPGTELTRAEVARAHDAGISIGVVYETTGTTWQGGYKAGAEDGASAASAMNALGSPASVAVYHAIDSHVPSSLMPVLKEWALGVSSTMGRYSLGFYGGALEVSAVRERLPGSYLWQTSAWSGGLRAPGVALFQGAPRIIGGVTCDTDVAFIGNFGQWRANLSRQYDGIFTVQPITGTITSGSQGGITVPAGSISRMQFYCDFSGPGDARQVVRVAALSQSTGSYEIGTLTITDNLIHTVPFSAHDVCAVSLLRGATDGIRPISYCAW